MKLYVIRHGESENNVKGLFTGWVDAALTQNGLEDAASIRPFLSKIPFDKIYSSDLSRARQTAETAIPGCTYETTPLLREIGVGNLGNRSFEEWLTKDNGAYADDIKARNYVPFGGEDSDMLAARIREFMDLAAQSGCENIAAFSHGAWLGNMLRLVIGQYDRFSVKCPNCTIGVFEFSDDKWKLCSWIDPKTLNL